MFVRRVEWLINYCCSFVGCLNVWLSVYGYTLRKTVVKLVLPQKPFELRKIQLLAFLFANMLTGRSTDCLSGRSQHLVEGVPGKGRSVWPSTLKESNKVRLLPPAAVMRAAITPLKMSTSLPARSRVGFQWCACGLFIPSMYNHFMMSSALRCLSFSLTFHLQFWSVT